MPHKIHDSEAKRVGRFGVVGVLNTLIDFTIYDVLIKQFGFSAVMANIPAATVAMIFSFFANKKAVFKDKDQGLDLKQVVLFFAVTGFGLWGIQNVIIHFLTAVWTMPADIAWWFVQLFHFNTILGGLIDYDFTKANTAKVCATAASMVWNYLMYRNFIFKNKAKIKAPK